MRWCSCFSIAMIVAAACGGDVTSFRDEGTVCLQSRSDGVLDVSVFFPTCLSSTCDTVLDNRCSVNVEGATIVVASFGSFESPRRGSCSADCRALVADCASEESVPPGDYTVMHGEDQGPLEAPTELTVIGESGFWDCSLF
jgi:hypothetical protein